MNLKKSGIRWGQPYRSPTLSTDTPFPEAERLVTTANVTSKTTDSNSVLPSTASNDIQQHVNSANSDCHSDSDSCAPEVMALNPTCLLQVSDFSTHLYLGSGPL
jgi:hypothetical protein